jgi:hypothetical protein
VTLTELLLSYLPLLAVFIFALVVVWKGGLLQVGSHRRRVEELLERIAIAVEAKSKDQ